MNDNADPAYYTQTLDPDPHVADLLDNVADTLTSATRPYRRVPAHLVGIASENDGGIIAYAIGEEHAAFIVKALNAMEVERK